LRIDFFIYGSNVYKTMTGSNNKYISNNGHQINYKIINVNQQSVDKPYLVFLHDGLGSVKQWRDFPKSLCDLTGLPAVVYDRYGYGESDKLEKPHKLSYFHNEAVIILPDLLKALNIENKIILIGHSDGGSIALIFASEFPEKVKGVITEAAHVFTEEITLNGIRNTVMKYEKGKFKDFLKNYHDNNTESMLRGWSDLWLDEGFKSWNIKSSLKKIRCPLLAIQGENDEYGTLKHIEIITNEVKGPVESLIIEKCGHIPHHQTRELVLENMKSFILKILSANL